MGTFFAKYLPDVLLAPGPAGLLWWQWLAIPGILFLAYAGGSLLGWITRRVLGHVASRTRVTWDDALLVRLAGPLTFAWGIAVVGALYPALALGRGAEGVLQHVLRAAAYLAFFWAGFRSVDVAFAVAAEAPVARTSPSFVGLLPFLRKVSKLALLALGLVAVLNELGFQVASLLAGVGIGGIALALAAQKTVEDLFASVTIGVDQPFRVGDLVRVDDVTGTVEGIGMRSTRIRTLDRTLVTIPNGKLANQRAETFAARDRMRLLANLGLVYDTSAEQVRAVLAGIEAELRGHPKVWPEGISVRFTEFKDSSLNVEVAAWFQTADWSEFTLIRQDLYLRFMEIVERAGSSFAFPTRTVHLVEGRGREP